MHFEDILVNYHWPIGLEPIKNEMYCLRGFTKLKGRPIHMNLLDRYLWLLTVSLSSRKRKACNPVPWQYVI